jgi:hypothetical protein
VRREHAILLAIAAVIGLWALAPSSAHAAGCTDEWTNTAGGSWFTPSNWSNGLPPKAEEEACITASGTYTVTMTQTATTGPVTIRSLTVGGISGTQTLTVAVCSSKDEATLSATAGIGNGAQGVIELTGVPPGAGEACGAPGSTTLSGSIGNAGKIVVEPVSNGSSRHLQGNLTNTGTLAIEANTAYDGTGAKLTNEGAIEIATGTQLTIASGDSVVNGPGGWVAAGGSGDLRAGSGALFSEGAGTTSGARPVVVDDGTLNYTGTSSEHGTGPIAVLGRSTLTGNVRHGQSLTVESTCAEEAEVADKGEKRSDGDYYFTNGGTLELTSDSCGRNIFAQFGQRFENYGTFVIDNPHVGYFKLERCIALNNYGVVQLNATPASEEHRQAPTLEIESKCRFNQASTGSFKTFIAGPSDFGRLAVPAGGRVEGTLVVRPIAPFVGSAGQLFTIIQANGTGVEKYFSAEIENPINYTGLYYKPTYGSEKVELDVTQVTEKRTPGKGSPGTLVTVSGSGYAQRGYTEIYPIALTFTDHAGVKTVFPISLIESEIVHAGEFSMQIEIPTTAALGAGKLTVSGTKSDVHISLPFTVT